MSVDSRLAKESNPPPADSSVSSNPTPSAEPVASHSEIIINPQITKPPSGHRNPIVIASCLCQNCRYPLDFPYVFQQCQHVVCARCAVDQNSLLCPGCVNLHSMNKSNQFLTATASIGYSRQVATLVENISGRQWVETARARLERESNATFLHSTVPAVKWKRVDIQPNDSNAKPKNEARKKRKHEDSDSEEQYDFANEGCCMCLLRGILCCPCECCCPKIRTKFCLCSGKIFGKVGKFIAGFLLLILVATLLNWAITGSSDLTNVLGNESSYQTYLGGSPVNLDTPLTSVTPPSPPPSSPPIKLSDIDPAVLELLLQHQQTLNQQGTPVKRPRKRDATP